jgi:hypothetical protein
MPARMKFWERIERTPTCWLWTGPLDRDGYGITHAKGVRLAHRLSWVLHRGPIPKPLQIDHLCRVRACVNPDHLELVTAVENVMRGQGPTAVHARQTHCINGHPFDELNTTVETSRDGRQRRRCRTCKTATDRRQTERDRIRRQQARRDAA